MLQAIESVFTLDGKAEWYIILGKLDQGFRDSTIVSYKAPIEITETKEGLHTFNCGRVLPFTNDGDFLRINFKALS